MSGIKINKICNKQSLAETLWNLEAVRLGLLTATKKDTNAALSWVVSRQGGQNAYGRMDDLKFFSLTARDLKGSKLPSGEAVPKSASNLHILGEEAYRALALWGKQNSGAAKQANALFERILDVRQNGSANSTPRNSGRFCCSKCTLGFLRTVAAVRPERHTRTLNGGAKLLKNARTPDGRWHRYPFYYALLTLIEMDTPNAQRELRYARPVAEKLISRYAGKTDRASLFRHYALQKTLEA